MPIRITHNVLVPAWVMIVGLVFLNAPPLGVAASLSLFMAGVLVIPALVLIPRAILLGAPARMTTHMKTIRTTCRVSVRWIRRLSEESS